MGVRLLLKRAVGEKSIMDRPVALKPVGARTVDGFPTGPLHGLLILGERGPTWTRH